MKIEYTLTAPVSHIGEVASTGSYFQTINTAYGRLPVITGNAVRGQLRDSMALRFCSLAETKLDKETFHIFFSGGNLNSTIRDDIEKAKSIRQHFPMISLLGGGLGDMIMAGKSIFSFLYPVCSEAEQITKIRSDISWHSLIDEIEFTRMDDSKSDIKGEYINDIDAEKQAKASTQMRFTVQYMAAGTKFVQDIKFLHGITEIEQGALYSGLAEWFKVPRLGGMSAKGFGMFDAKVDGDDLTVMDGEIRYSNKVGELISRYEDFVKEEKGQYLDLFAVQDKKKAKKEKDG